MSFRGVTWHIQRRFSEFARLHERLLREPQLPAMNLGNSKNLCKPVVPDLPPRRWFGRFEENFLNERLFALRAFMEGVLVFNSISERPALSEFLGFLVHVPNLDSTGPFGSGEQDDGEEATETNRLVALEEEFAKALIDVSRTGTDPILRAEALLQKATLLRACDYFKAHAPHLKLYFRDEVPRAVIHEEGSIVETLSLPPCDPSDVHVNSALDQCMMVVMDNLHSMGKATVGSREHDEEQDLVCYLHPTSTIS